MKFLQPENWPRPKGYANGVSARGRMIFTAGVIGWDENESVVSHVFEEQFDKTLENILAILAVDGAGPEHIVRMTIYVTDKQEYMARLREVGAAWRDVIGKHFPAMALVQVGALVEDRANIEIETTAVVPE